MNENQLVTAEERARLAERARLEREAAAAKQKEIEEKARKERIVCPHCGKKLTPDGKKVDNAAD